jgi:hypothetical protein
LRFADTTLKNARASEEVAIHKNGSQAIETAISTMLR